RFRWKRAGKRAARRDIERRRTRAFARLKQRELPIARRLRQGMRQCRERQGHRATGHDNESDEPQASHAANMSTPSPGCQTFLLDGEEPGVRESRPLMRRSLLILVALSACVMAGSAVATSSKAITCLSASDVSKASGFAASSVQPMN